MLNIQNTALAWEYTILRGKDHNYLWERLEVFQVYRKQSPSLAFLAPRPGLPGDTTRPEAEPQEWHLVFPGPVAPHTQPEMAVSRRAPQAKHRRLWNRCAFHLLFISRLFLTSLRRFCCFITLESPSEYYSGVKLPHLIQSIALGSKFYFLFLMLDSKWEALFF